MKVGIVIGGVVVATGLTVLKDLLEGKKQFRPVIAGFVVGTLLLTIAMFSAPIAAALALLLLATSVMTNSIPILTKVSGYFG